TSDLARISNQQQLMVTLLSQAVSTGKLTNPLRFQAMLTTVTAAIKVDKNFNIDTLASQLKGIRPSDVAFSTVPLGNFNYQTPDGQSAVTWDTAAASRFFTRMRQDRPPAALAGPSSDGGTTASTAARSPAREPAAPSAPTPVPPPARSEPRRK